VVLPEPAWPSKTIFFTCEVSNSAMARKFYVKNFFRSPTRVGRNKFSEETKYSYESRRFIS